MALRGAERCPITITMQNAFVSTPRAAAPNFRAPALRVRALLPPSHRGKAIARSSTSSSSSSSSSSPLAGLLSFLKGKPDPSTAPPGIKFVSGSGVEAISDPSEVAELLRSGGFDSSPRSSGPGLPPASRSLSELTTGLPISGGDETRVARGIRYTWRAVAAFVDHDEEGEEEGGGRGDAAAAAAQTESENAPPRPRRRRKLVGLARLLSDGSFAVYLSDVVVDPQYRNRGIGRALVAAAIAEALREPGPASSVVTWARPGRPRLFLQRCGFRVSVAYRVLRYEEEKRTNRRKKTEYEREESYKKITLSLSLSLSLSP